jgi:hypothetical protein
MKQKPAKRFLLGLFLGGCSLLLLINCGSSPEEPTRQTQCLYFSVWHCEGPPHELSAVKAGQTYSFHRILRNDGTTPCNNIIVNSYWSPDNHVGLDFEDTLLRQEIYVNTSSHQSYEAFVDLTIPATAISGRTYWVGTWIGNSSCSSNPCTRSAVWQVTVE